MEQYTISEIARLFNVSTRTVRYYEELGLLSPVRKENGQRVYARKERTRLELIFRGKNFGFQLDEIKEMIVLFDQDRTGERQLKRTIQYGKEKLREVDARIDELNKLREDMTWYLESFVTKLKEGERE
ncbi:MerR family transcriptional regulator [Alkalihalobacillus hwajinpoensis]|uniref:MerR family transcriptional regulator n=1 Tax=Guptibacillus hwajinpoensis TaxID=208199 RepID=UPI0018836615|nr:MerR family transcriptional regulator [Pseudalkalibacillus hwajinpoensis]MBF0708522.1 MerR family transcriptional regulator [Pseudalkalibacillus hwajinpoensis]